MFLDVLFYFITMVCILDQKCLINVLIFSICKEDRSLDEPATSSERNLYIVLDKLRIASLQIAFPLPPSKQT